ncbi:hypothetical protein FS749_013129 [Ceratobasidium sp. UAMH 11750]|nr:hypothetical protein FS749_013129 [Ceratobasidium sp. UAMH 11750]
MLEIASHILPAISEFGTMVAGPILAAAFLVAVGGGALDDTIIGVEDSLIRWWRELFHRKRPLLITADGDKSTRDMGMHNGQALSRSPGATTIDIEQVELTPRKERRRTMAEEAVASFAHKPSSPPRSGPPPTSPRVIGTRRRRSRGNSHVEMELNNF